MAAVEINGFHLIVCDDNKLPFSPRLLGQLHVDDGDRSVEHADFLDDDGVDRTADAKKRAENINNDLIKLEPYSEKKNWNNKMI